jgi:hypothetical protein
MEKSRRQIIQAALIALPAVGALKALAADKAPAAAAKLPAGQATFRLSKNNLAHLTNSLYNNPAERQKFLGDPKGFAEGLFKARLDGADTQKLQNIKQMFADGFCCGGCGCSNPIGAEVERSLSR